MKKTNTDWEEIFANDIFDEGLVLRINKELSKLSNNNNKQPIKRVKTV